MQLTTIVYVAAQIKILKVDPTATDAAIEAIHGPHIAMYNSGNKDAHKLIIMIVGTNGTATGSRVIDSSFASIGYHVISVDYPNKIAAVTCSDSNVPDCFEQYRQEIVTGAPVSEIVKVDTVNSILNRVERLLAYLIKNDLAGGWNQFMESNHPQWSKIIAAGHSQGAGHAAYVAKLFKLERVLLFSGPQDYSNKFQSPASWQSLKSATPTNRYYAFLHLNDPYKVKNQLQNCSKLMQTTAPDSVSIKPLTPVAGNNHILVTDVATPHLHSATLQPMFENVWRYMLTNKYD